jgi:hypothetical protein
VRTLRIGPDMGTLTRRWKPPPPTHKPWLYPRHLGRQIRRCDNSKGGDVAFTTNEAIEWAYGRRELYRMSRTKMAYNARRALRQWGYEPLGRSKTGAIIANVRRML